LILAFLARAPLYLSVFPPFEGWDEYQHVAYIAHLDEAGTVPVFDQSWVPTALRPLMISVPHSQWGGDQVRQWGARSYPEYWNSATTSPDGEGEPTPLIRLYQAQQPPLAYVVALPVWRAFGSVHRLAAIYAIRAMNVLLVAGALVVFAAALTRLVPEFAPRVAVLAIVCLYPLFFQNVARVANDAIAVATGVVGISLLVLADQRTLLSRAALAGVCIALSVWTKQTSLTLIPALILGPPLIGWAHRVSASRLWRVTLIASVVFVLLVAPLWTWSYRHYGTFLTTQDSIQLTSRGAAFAALAASFVALPWAEFIDTLFVPGRPWVGGWSFLAMPATLEFLHRWLWILLLIAALAGAVVAMRRHARSFSRLVAVLREDGGDVARLAVCAAVVVFTALGMTYHGILSHAVFGRSMTNPWYFMTALPFLFVLVVRGLEVIGRRLAVVGPAAMGVLFVVMDLHGTWVQMPSAYAATTDVALQWSRLSAIHPGILSGDLRWLFLTLQLGALCLVVVSLIYTSRRTGELSRV
jgi:hypothetical protein